MSGLLALRVIQASKRLTELMRLQRVLEQTFPMTRSFILVWVMFVLVATLVGTQIFSGYTDFNPGPKPRAHFDYFGWSLLSVYQLCSVENWNDLEVHEELLWRIITGYLS